MCKYKVSFENLCHFGQHVIYIKIEYIYEIKCFVFVECVSMKIGKVLKSTCDSSFIKSREDISRLSNHKSFDIRRIFGICSKKLGSAFATMNLNQNRRLFRASKSSAWNGFPPTCTSQITFSPFPLFKALTLKSSFHTSFQI